MAANCATTRCSTTAVVTASESRAAATTKRTIRRWVEQRNWLAIRRLVGHDRYTSHRAHTVLQGLYRRVQLHLNFFRPLRKCSASNAAGPGSPSAMTARRRRINACSPAAFSPPPTGGRLEAQLLALNPATLSADVTRALAILSGLADTPARMMPSRVTQL